MNLCPKSYTSAADDSVASIMAVQAHMKVTVSTETNKFEYVLPQCRHVFFTSSMLLPGGKPLFLTLVHSVNHISSVSDHW